MGLSPISVRRLCAEDADLDDVLAQLNSEQWGDSDPKFSASSLAAFLESEERIYLVAYSDSRLVGAVHAYLLVHPAGHRVAYVDEVGTLASFRRRGIARAMMEELLEIARRAGATEAWLGTEDDNEAAKGLYESLQPSEVESPSVIFTYDLSDTSSR